MTGQGVALRTSTEIINRVREKMYPGFGFNVHLSLVLSQFYKMKVQKNSFTSRWSVTSYWLPLVVPGKCNPRNEDQVNAGILFPVVGLYDFLR